MENLRRKGGQKGQTGANSMGEEVQVEGLRLLLLGHPAGPLFGWGGKVRPPVTFRFAPPWWKALVGRAQCLCVEWDIGYRGDRGGLSPVSIGRGSHRRRGDVRGLPVCSPCICCVAFAADEMCTRGDTVVRIHAAPWWCETLVFWLGRDILLHVSAPGLGPKAS